MSINWQRTSKPTLPSPSWGCGWVMAVRSGLCATFCSKHARTSRVWSDDERRRPPAPDAGAGLVSRRFPWLLVHGFSAKHFVALCPGQAERCPAQQHAVLRQRSRKKRTGATHSVPHASSCLAHVTISHMLRVIPAGEEEGSVPPPPPGVVSHTERGRGKKNQSKYVAQEKEQCWLTLSRVSPGDILANVSLNVGSRIPPAVWWCMDQRPFGRLVSLLRSGPRSRGKAGSADTAPGPARVCFVTPSDVIRLSSATAESRVKGTAV